MSYGEYYRLWDYVKGGRRILYRDHSISPTRAPGHFLWPDFKGSQGARYPVVKESTLNDAGIPNGFSGFFKVSSSITGLMLRSVKLP